VKFKLNSPINRAFSHFIPHNIIHEEINSLQGAVKRSIESKELSREHDLPP
jgi:hypothetical protein